MIQYFHKERKKVWEKADNLFTGWYSVSDIENAYTVKMEGTRAHRGTEAYFCRNKTICYVFTKNYSCS